MIETIFGAKKDAEFMQEALAQAQLAFDVDEVPIGAVVVNSAGQIVSRAYNMVEKEHTQRAHAESLALDNAGKIAGDWRLNDHWLYVTLEPCAMCIGLAKLSRLAGVAYGATSPLFGFHLDNEDAPWVYKKDMLLIIEGVRADDSVRLLKHFFQQKRRTSV